MTIRVNRFETSFSSSILHNHTYRIFYRVLLINVSKTGNTKSFSKTIYGAPYRVNKKYMVLFSPDFECKVDSFNLYIINNYVKRTTVFPRINARGVYFKIRDFRGRSFERGVYSRGAFISKFQK